MSGDILFQLWIAEDASYYLEPNITILVAGKKNLSHISINVFFIEWKGLG